MTDHSSNMGFLVDSSQLCAGAVLYTVASLVSPEATR